MPRSVTLTFAVVDRMVELVQELDRACTPPPLPPRKQRDPALWQRALTEAKEERAAAVRKAQAGAIHCPGRQPARETQEEARARCKRAGREVLEKAESKYRRLDPALWAETKQRRETAKALAAELAESFLWHGPALDRLSRLGKRREELYACAAVPQGRGDDGFRACISQDLASIRLKLEETARASAPLDLAKRAELMADKLESWAHRVAEWIRDQSVETEPNAKEKLPIVMGLVDCLPKEDIVSLEEYLRWHKPEVGKSLAEERRELVGRSGNLLKRSNAGAFFLFVNALTGGAREVACKLRTVAALIRSEQKADPAPADKPGGPGSSPASGENSEGKAQGDDNVNQPPAGEEQEDKLPPSRVKAKAAYDYALTVITDAGNMTVAQLFDALQGRLDAEICKAVGKQAEEWQQVKDYLPDNAATWGKYLRDAGVKRYDKAGERRQIGRSIRPQSEI